MVHRGIVTLSAALMASFLLLTQLDQGFFLLHFYQSLIYLVIILMFFYFEDRYAYMLGMLAPAVWLLLTFATGMLGGGARQISRLMHAQRPTNEVSLMAGLMAVLSALMIVLCALRWRREFSGLGKGLRTFLVSFGVVIVYYTTLVIWFWHSVPQVTTAG